VKRRKGSLHYIEIAVLMPLGYLACAFIGVFCVGFPNPGVYALRLLPWLDGLLTRLAVVGFINVVCCGAMIYGLSAVLSRLRRPKGAARGH